MFVYSRLIFHKKCFPLFFELTYSFFSRNKWNSFDRKKMVQSGNIKNPPSLCTNLRKMYSIQHRPYQTQERSKKDCQAIATSQLFWLIKKEICLNSEATKAQREPISILNCNLHHWNSLESTSVSFQLNDPKHFPNHTIPKGSSSLAPTKTYSCLFALSQ